MLKDLNYQYELFLKKYNKSETDEDFDFNLFFEEYAARSPKIHNIFKKYAHDLPESRCDFNRAYCSGIDIIEASPYKLPNKLDFLEDNINIENNSEINSLAHNSIPECISINYENMYKRIQDYNYKSVKFCEYRYNFEFVKQLHKNTNNRNKLAELYDSTGIYLTFNLYTRIFTTLYKNIDFFIKVSKFDVSNIDLNSAEMSVTIKDLFNFNLHDNIRKFSHKVPHRWNAEWTQWENLTFIIGKRVWDEEEINEDEEELIDLDTFTFETDEDYTSHLDEIKSLQKDACKFYKYIYHMYNAFSISIKKVPDCIDILIIDREALRSYNLNPEELVLKIFMKTCFLRNEGIFRSANVIDTLLMDTNRNVITNSNAVVPHSINAKKLGKKISLAFIRMLRRTYTGSNLGKQFEKLFFTGNSKLRASGFIWLNPMRKKKNSIVSQKLNIFNLQKNRNFNLKYKFNNYFPIFALHANTFLKHYRTFFSKSSPTYSYYFNYYLIYFLESYIKSKVWVKLNTRVRVPNSVTTKLRKIVAKNYRDYHIIGKHLFALEMYELLWLSLFYKDLSLFAKWFKRIMEKISFKQHRKMITIIYNAVRLYPDIFLVTTNTRGFSMDVRGKLGATGNAKKRHLAFTVGKITFTTKKYPLHTFNNTIETPTGVLGVSYFIMN